MTGIRQACYINGFRCKFPDMDLNLNSQCQQIGMVDSDSLTWKSIWLGKSHMEQEVVHIYVGEPE